MLDTYREVVTPEGVALHLPAAGPVPRAVAWGIDLCVRFGLLSVAGMLLGLLGGMGAGVNLIVLFGVYWVYPIVLEAAWNGQTVGKKAMALRVVSADGAPLGWLAAVVRNLLRTVDMLPAAYAVGLVSCLVDPNGRRLGDLVAGTVVVHVEPPPVSIAAPADAVLAPPTGLRPAEQVAVIAFGERAPQLSVARQVELADILSPLTHARGQPGVLRLYGMANWLLGRR